MSAAGAVKKKPTCTLKEMAWADPHSAVGVACLARGNNTRIKVKKLEKIICPKNKSPPANFSPTVPALLYSSEAEPK